MRIKNNLISEFDAFSVNYTEDMTKCVPYYLALTSAFGQNYADHFNPNAILDLGCGNGNATALLLELFPDAKFTLVDAAQDMLDLCQKRFKNSNINYELSYFKDYDFEKEHFDLVIAGFSLHHCKTEEKQFLFNKIHHCLKPGGLFCSSDLMISKTNPDYQDLINFWKTFVLGNYPDDEKWQWLMEHHHEYDSPDNYADQISWLEVLGFEIVDSMIYNTYWAHYKVMKT